MQEYSEHRVFTGVQVINVA